jgi:hypothetical protein
LRKSLNPPPKKSVEWMSYNFSLLSRIALSLFSSVSLFCDCSEMTINNKGIASPWMAKGPGYEHISHPNISQLHSQILFKG